MSEEHDSHDTGPPLPPAYPFWVRAEEERLTRDWSLTKLSEVSTVARNTYNRLKKQPGKAEPKTISQLAEALGIPKQEAMDLAGLRPVAPAVGEAATEIEEAEIARLEKLMERIPVPRRKMLEGVIEQERARTRRLEELARADLRSSLTRIEHDIRWEIERGRSSLEGEDDEDEEGDRADRDIYAQMR